MVMYDQYTWIFAVSFIFSFACAFGIGANDVANAFASSVGAKAITMGQAILVAAVCEFAGAVLLGAGVTDTIKNKIAKTSAFATTPDILMIGFLAVMITAAFWDNMACQLQMPVSTTHTTVGATVGMAVASYGFDAVVWSQEQDAFPFVTGMSSIFLSWVISPCLAGFMTCILFFLVRTFILRSNDGFRRAGWSLPFFVFITFFVVVIFVIQTGNKNATWDTVPEGKIVWIAAIIGFGLAVLSALLVVPKVKRDILAEADARARYLESKAKSVAAEDGAAGPDSGAKLADGGKLAGGKVVETVDVDGKPVQVAQNMEEANVSYLPPKEKTGLTKKWEALWTGPRGQKFANTKFFKFFTYGANFDIHKEQDDNMEVQRVWANAEVFDWKIERFFRYLQVFSAVVMSFAHGSNDVANAMGPFSGVYYIWQNGTVPSKSPVPTWILVIGGAGLVCGLAIFGYKIIMVLGAKAVKLTNSRGFCAESATAMTVILASRYGLPVSTTQIICGSILAIGLFEGVGGVNWRVMFRIFGGWVLTLVIASCLAAGIQALFIYSPNKTASQDAYQVGQALGPNTKYFITQAMSAGNETVMEAAKKLNSTYTAFTKSAIKDSGLISKTNAQAFSLFNSTL